MKRIKHFDVLGSSVFTSDTHLSASDTELLNEKLNEAELVWDFTDNFIKHNDKEQFKPLLKQAKGMNDDLSNCDFINITVSNLGLGIKMDKISNINVSKQSEWLQDKIKKADKLINQDHINWMFIYVEQFDDEYKQSTELMPKSMVKILIETVIQKLEDAIN